MTTTQLKRLPLSCCTNPKSQLAKRWRHSGLKKDQEIRRKERITVTGPYNLWSSLETGLPLVTRVLTAPELYSSSVDVAELWSRKRELLCCAPLFFGHTFLVKFYPLGGWFAYDFKSSSGTDSGDITRKSARSKLCKKGGIYLKPLLLYLFWNGRFELYPLFLRCLPHRLSHTPAFFIFSPFKISSTIFPGEVHTEGMQKLYCTLKSIDVPVLSHRSSASLGLDRNFAISETVYPYVSRW